MILIGKRVIVGILRGYDDFMNLVMDNAKEIVNGNQIGNIGFIVIRGNSIIQIEQIINHENKTNDDDDMKSNKKIDIDLL